MEDRETEKYGGEAGRDVWEAKKRFERPVTKVRNQGERVEKKGVETGRQGEDKQDGSVRR